MIRNLVSATRSVRYAFDRLSYNSFCDTDPLAEYRDAYRNQPMLVVGNGPSLNDTPLDRFSSLPSIGMNKIDMLFKRTIWRPTLIVAVNNLVVIQHADAFRKSEIPIFVGWKARWYVKKPRGKVNFYLSRNTLEFSRDLPAGVGVGGTVTYDALQFAYYMGANPVILFGVDHSFAVEGRARSYVKRSGPDVNHFDKDYFKSGSYWGVPDLELSERAYAIARDSFAADGREVLDATVGGKLQIFRKISLSEALDFAQAPAA